MTAVNFTSDSGSGYLEADHDQIKGLVEDGTYEAPAFAISSDVKLNLEGTAGNSYILYNSTASKVELWVNGVKKADWG